MLQDFCLLMTAQVANAIACFEQAVKKRCTATAESRLPPIDLNGHNSGNKN